MLQYTETGIFESGLPTTSGSGCNTVSVTQTNTGGYVPMTNTTIYVDPCFYQPYYYWHAYPVYVCTDKTKKAIEVLKALEADKLVKLTSVKSFIALVEKIAGIL